MATLIKRYPGAAVVTGASAGIGEGFARRLAAEGFELALVARRREALEALAEELHGQHGVKVHVIAQDLAVSDGAAKVKAATDALGLKVSLLINNAGYGSWGLFHELYAAAEAKMVDLNCRGVVQVAAAYTPEMVARKNGAMIITSSVAAFQPCPYFATYAATKAFDLYFAGALWAELKPHGVDVTAICPGYTKTEFQKVAGINAELESAMRLPSQVVETALRKLGHGPVATDGVVNQIAGLAAKFSPRRAAIKVAFAALSRMKL